MPQAADTRYQGLEGATYQFRAGHPELPTRLTGCRKQSRANFRALYLHRQFPFSDAGEVVLQRCGNFRVAGVTAAKYTDGFPAHAT